MAAQDSQEVLSNRGLSGVIDSVAAVSLFELTLNIEPFPQIVGD